MFVRIKYRKSSVWAYSSILFLLCNPLLFAQEVATVPQPESKLIDSQSDSLLKEGYNYLNAGQYLLAGEFYEKTLLLAKKNQNLKMEAFCWHQLGLLGKKQGNYAQSLEFYEKALKIRELQKDEKRIANTLVAIADIYVVQGNPPKSYEYQLKALSIAERIGDKAEMQVALNGIGQYYHWQNDWKRALDCFQKAYQICEELQDKRWMAFSLNNMADVYRIERNYPEALNCLLKSLKIREELQNKHEIAMSFNDLGFLYLRLNDIPVSLEYYKKAIRIFSEVGSKPNLALSLVNAGEVYLKVSQFDSSFVFTQRGLTLAKSIGMKYTIRKAYLVLSQTYQHLNDFENALENYKNYVALKDTLFNEEKSRQMTELNTRYETGKKEVQITLLNKDNQIKALALEEQFALTERKKAELALLMKEKELEEARIGQQNVEIHHMNQEKTLQQLLFQQAEQKRTGQINLLEKENAVKAKEIENQQLKLRNWLLFGFTGIFVAGTLVTIFMMQQRQRLRLETEKRLRENIISQFENLKNQINPHFLLNSLNSLSVLIGTHPEKAQFYTQEFSKVYRHVLELKDNFTVNLQEELDMCKAFISLQKLRFGENLEVYVKIEDSKLQQFLPPLSLQLLVENAVKHNEISSDRPLKIHIFAEGDYLVVINNLQSRSYKEPSTHIGLKNLTERYKLASDKLPEFSIINNEYIAKIPLL